MKNQIVCGDCLEILKYIPPRSFDLVFFSPPYEDARTYGIDFNLKGQEWVDWMVGIYRMCLSRCKGLVAGVVQGRTRKYKWSCTPALLIADLHRAGFNVRNPPIFHRFGIPGSGGPDWLRSDYEWVVCVSQPGKLVWSDNTACGNPPKFGPGGDPTHRKKDGKRINVKETPSWFREGMHTGKQNKYRIPKIANPGNIIRCSGGHLGNKLAHENEAPFPEKLAEFFIRSFCPPDGWVLDPFSGSGTTAAVAKKWGRNYTGIDIRQSQVDLANRRLAEIENG